jgi:hypothetical protein
METFARLSRQSLSSHARIVVHPGFLREECRRNR